MFNPDCSTYCLVQCISPMLHVWNIYCTYIWLIYGANVGLVGLEHVCFSIQLGMIIPIDELLFFRGVGEKPTTNQLQNWLIFRANVGEYSIHGAYGSADSKPFRSAWKILVEVTGLPLRTAITTGWGSWLRKGGLI